MVRDDLPKCEANYAPLTPITFIQRAAAVFPDRCSVIYGDQRFKWAQTYDRCLRVASALSSHGISPGDTVSVVAANIPAMYELHFAVPMAGAILNTINFRLDARTISLLLSHCEAKLVFVDTEFLPVVYEALRVHFPRNVPKPFVVHIRDEAYPKYAEVTAAVEFKNLLEYEDLLKRGEPNFAIRWPKDEWDAISINYTSGTTAAPKGVVYHHRGAYLNSLSTVLDWDMPTGPVYLWTLPMFHCNGWCFTWTLAARAGTSVCLRYMIPKTVFAAIHEHRVTHLGGAPTVLTMLANAAEDEKKPLQHKVSIVTGAGPPAAAILARVEALGFSVTHGYGMTETYGPSVMNIWKEEWDALPLEERAQTMARQGVGSLTFPVVDVMDPKTMVPVPRDGKTMGELMIKGHCVMKGYLKNKRATDEAFEGGMLHTGDIAVMHPDGYLQLKDRSKDIIISGGENISSIEVESILYTHPHVLEAAVVARPDDFWGETPCAFITLLSSAPSDISEKSIIEWCRKNMTRYMVPRSVVFGELPKTSTGKMQKNVLRERAKKMGSLTTPVGRSRL
ncbi:unnamed protein product [Calypogeia fissa]